MMYNGGISLAVKLTADAQAQTEIRTVTGYDVTYTTESESFEMYDCSTHTAYKGDRFSANVTTGVMDPSELSSLRAALLHHEFYFVCPEYPTGIKVQLTSLSQPLEVANFGRRYYRLSFAVKAVELINNSGGYL